MKNALQLRLSQHLTLTPQLQQSIRLLQLSTLDLNQELERFLQENPLLEREDDGDPGLEPLPAGLQGGEQPGTAVAEPEAEARNDDRPTDQAAEHGDGFEFDGLPDSSWSSDEGSFGARDTDEDSEYSQQVASSPTLREHLLGQLSLTPLPERDKVIIELLIEALDEDGYLAQDLSEIATILPEEAMVEIEELEIALKHLQHFDPLGVGARTLGECLGLQLQAMPPAVPCRTEALIVVRDHLDALAARDFTRLRRTLRCDEDRLRGVQELIGKLNPRPGAPFATVDTRYVIPDVVVKKVKGMWVSSLNPDAMPKLRINRMYAEILRRNRDASHGQLASQLQEAKWLIKNVQQRFETIQRVSQAIVDRQRQFFEHGEVAMRPLVLREIAEVLDLHESTVSRVTTQKFMLTPRGIFELKYFFGSHVSTESGGSCSATAIRALIRQLVGSEDTRKPLSDSQIADILGQQGIVVARRTIAKYRESLQILPVNLRKTI
ncbi:MAG: RNA polymerase factor sigma-54 [bacterium]|jgi:RNA polymerase sigma-54 factor|nr:RNA polymerase factor sigma-54 [Betaproteobacteria bacterium]